mmetsp:Transcript_120705/g.346829  ORF Transcript_120705/g.346829 Transcript_120705/m.346829 type:complete len:291 (+) Transcript_120705:708-1580(+)
MASHAVLQPDPVCLRGAFGSGSGAQCFPRPGVPESVFNIAAGINRCLELEAPLVLAIDHIRPQWILRGEGHKLAITHGIDDRTPAPDHVLLVSDEGVSAPSLQAADDRAFRACSRTLQHISSHMEIRVGPHLLHGHAVCFVGDRFPHPRLLRRQHLDGPGGDFVLAVLDDHDAVEEPEPVWHHADHLQCDVVLLTIREPCKEWREIEAVSGDIEGQNACQGPPQERVQSAGVHGRERVLSASEVTVHKNTELAGSSASAQRAVQFVDIPELLAPVGRSVHIQAHGAGAPR